MAYVLNKMLFLLKFLFYKCDMVLLMVPMYIVIIICRYIAQCFGCIMCTVIKHEYSNTNVTKYVITVITCMTNL